LKGLHFFKTKSIQRYVRPTLAETMIHCRDLVSSNPDLFESVRIVPTTRLPVGGKECHKCTHKGRNYACPPYASPIEINLWTHAVIWKWSGNDRDKDGYNRAFLEFHKKVFSLGHYLSLGLRDGPCDECTRCALNVGKNTECPHRRLMAPSMQSQGIDKSRFGSGRYGIELI
jgi:predicted metal-binding protein